MRQRWRELFGNPPPKSLRRAFLVKACAYGIQVKAFGGLSAATKKRLRQIAEAARTGSALPASSALRIKPGTRLVRAWQGKTHTVTVLADGGFEWNGTRYRSLSAIAGAITGTSWNGRTFFGLKKRAPRAGGANGNEKAQTALPARAENHGAGRPAVRSRRGSKEVAAATVSAATPPAKPESPLEDSGHG